MSTQEAMALLAVVVGIIVVVGILGEAYKNRLEFKARALEAQAKLANENAAQSAAMAERLEQRVRVLERLATDRTLDSSALLAREIEDMRESAVN